MRRVVKKLAIIGLHDSKLAEFSCYSTWLWLTILGFKNDMKGVRVKRDNVVDKFDLWHTTEVPKWVYESKDGTPAMQRTSID